MSIRRRHRRARRPRALRLVTRLRALREDASCRAFYSAYVGARCAHRVALRSTIDLLNVLFGSILGVDNAALLLIAGSRLSR